MRFKIILFVIFICFYALFAALNLSNVTDISFGVTTVSQVPIFLAVTVAFAAGALFVIPFMFGHKKEKNEKPVKEKKKKGKEKDSSVDQIENNFNI